jgi:hypothetical protein
MNFSELNDDNYVLFAMKSYENPQCSGIEEFHEDLNRIKYLKRLLRKYKTHGVLREQLILNHLIIFYNVFGIEPATRLLFNRIETDLHSYLKTFVVYLNNLPEKIPDTDLMMIPVDIRIANKLRKI